MFSSQNSQVSNDANYIEDVFSTYLYTGNGPSSQTITNGIDLAGKGGLVWFKRRDSGSPFDHELVDSAQGIGKFLRSNSTAGWGGVASDITSLNSNGFSINDNTGYANNGSMVSWTFRKQPKFYTQGTFTGDGTTNKVITHDLNGTTGFIIVKRTDSTGNWQCWHRTFTNKQTIFLNTTDAKQTYSGADDITVTDTSFTVGTNQIFGNGSGFTYVYYVFAHNAGGFGLTGTDNVISCGSFTSDIAGVDVNLGYEPQWVMIKVTNGVGLGWYIWDNMRGFPVGTGGKTLLANASDAEDTTSWISPTATGFKLNAGQIGTGNPFIYIAIRRGPMKVPTDATKVFEPVVATLNNGTISSTGSVGVVDSLIPIDKGTTADKLWQSRLTAGNWLATNNTNAENSSGYTTWDRMTGAKPQPWSYGDSHVIYNLKRAPSFFDEVCYTGDSTLGRAVPHNLAAIPELMIVKNRNNTENWVAYSAATGNTKRLILNSTVAAGVRAVWADTTPTSTNFYVGGSGVLGETNYTTYTYVAYLFATCAGVSKVGSYTGTGTTLQVNCGFTAGARFVLIKKTSGTGSWYVWDSARGIVSGNDPYLLLNSTAAEVTNTDYIDTYSAGFEISSTAPSEINENGGSFIFFAVA